MDYATIAERDPKLLTPTSPEKLLTLARYCRVRDGARVLDVGCGKGSLLRLWASRWAIEGTGLECCPASIWQARRAAEAGGLLGRLTYVEGPAADHPETPCGYDVVSCLGAPFAIGACFEQAVAWMATRLRTDGVLALGDQYLPAPVPRERLRREEMNPDRLHSVKEILAILRRQGLALTGFLAASQDEWDRYCGDTWRSAHAWARENRSHPDRGRILREVDRWRDRYFGFARHSLGWAIFVAERVEPTAGD